MSAETLLSAVAPDPLPDAEADRYLEDVNRAVSLAGAHNLDGLEILLSGLERAGLIQTAHDWGPELVCRYQVTAWNYAAKYMTVRVMRVE